MAKSKITYPNNIPNSIQDISKPYMEDYIYGELKAGRIPKAKMEEWIKCVQEAEANNPDSAQKVFMAYRKSFAQLFFPHLLAKNDNLKASEYYAHLLKGTIIDAQEEPNE